MNSQIITEFHNDNKEKVGYVYALLIPELKAIKFGVTNGTVTERVAALQTGCPLEIVPLACHLCDFSYELEKAIHNTFTSLAMKGEWFQYNDITAAFVWLNFRRILNAHLIPNHVLGFNPLDSRGEGLNSMYGGAYEMFASAYFAGIVRPQIKPLSIPQLSAIQKEITIGS